MGTQNDPKSGSKNEAKWGPKIDQNGDPKSIKMGTQNSMTHRGMTHSVILLYLFLFWGDQFNFSGLEILLDHFFVESLSIFFVGESPILWIPLEFRGDLKINLQIV